MFRNKLKLFAISLTAVWIVLFIKNVDIPVYFGGDSQFVGWARLLTYRNLIALFSVVMMAVSIHSIIQLRHRLKGSPSGLTVTLTVVKDKNYDYVNTLATIVTLFSVIFISVDGLRDLMVFLVLMAVVGICFLKTNLYYSNPMFAALGYKLYTVNSNCEKLKDDAIAIYHGNLSTDNKVRFYHISDNVYYLI